ncbi:apolipoprotein N-acyltransferase, partial [Mitsuaria sp. WAJ17]|nr:apolipoprotein N-acyltransferase [Mitsuaria sp. WAJ17]
MSKAWVRATGAVVLGVVLLALYARGSWGLGFVALLPWLWWLDQPASWSRRLLRAWALSLAYVLAAFTWFGTAIAHYAQWPQAQGQAVLLLIAPLLQPQLIVWALVRQGMDGRHRPWLRAWAAAAAWVGIEWLCPKVLGDTLAHGLYPAADLRQAAALGGTAVLTLTLLLANEALAHHLSQWGSGWKVRPRALLVPLGLALALPLLLLAYGASREAPRLDAGLPLLRVGLVQANIADYEGRRQSQGSYAVVREVLDVHYAMSYDAVERQRADAVLWSETIYPTTFGQPKSEAGAQLDQEIASIVNAAGVPFVFGTYDRDATAEYNAAAFVQPQQGLLGLYRKTRLFPFTEQVPAWLDGPLLQRWLPWAGRWQPGSGARVFPLRLRDGRELPVQPLICRDDVDPSLAIAGARLGARALLTMSNDAWFSADPLGARLHQAVAAFRSIETGLPQFRVTTNGYSAVIDARGTVHAAGDFGQRALVVGALPVPEPTPTLPVRWGNWVGPLCLASLAGLLLVRWRPLRGWAPQPAAPLGWPLRV